MGPADVETGHAVITRHSRAGRGPGGWFAKHPAMYAASLIGAAAGGLLFGARAARASGARRFGWAVLAAFQVVQFLGIRGAKAHATGLSSGPLLAGSGSRRRGSRGTAG